MTGISETVELLRRFMAEQGVTSQFLDGLNDDERLWLARSLDRLANRTSRIGKDFFPVLVDTTFEWNEFLSLAGVRAVRGDIDATTFNLAYRTAQKLQMTEVEFREIERQEKGTCIIHRLEMYEHVRCATIQEVAAVFANFPSLAENGCSVVAAQSRAYDDSMKIFSPCFHAQRATETVIDRLYHKEIWTPPTVIATISS